MSAPMQSLLGGLGVGAVFVLGAFYLPPAFGLGSGFEHALLDLCVALSACFCSLQALVRYQSKPEPLFLWLGAGFLASGLLDGLHGLLSLEPAQAGVTLQAVNLSWTLSSLLLTGYVVTGLWPLSVGSARRDQALVATVSVIAVTLAGTVLLGAPELLPLASGSAPRQTWELVAGIAMAAALPLAWRSEALTDAPLRLQLVSALALYAIVHAGIMAWSSTPLDVFVGLSHLGKFLAHWMVLVGLLQSSANRLEEAERSRERLALQALELKASERHIRSILEHAPYAILGADHQGVVRSINPVARQIFDIPHERAIGRSLASFFDASLHKELAAMLTPLRSMEGDNDDTSRSRWAMSRQARGIRGAGQGFPVALTLTDTVSAGQRYFTAFVRDLTLNIEQERRVHSALMLATRILDQSSVAILSTDASGLIMRFNRTAQRWLGYTEGEVIGRLTPDSFLAPEELEARAHALARDHGMSPVSATETVLALARRGMTDPREWDLQRKDGTRFPAAMSVAPLTTEAGDVTGFVVVATDLSEQKEVQRLKDEFVSTVSHELRTPLTSLRGSLGLLSGGVAGALPAAAKGLLDIAQRNTERLILLINDILDMEKMEAGKMDFTIAPLDLDALVAEAVQQAEGLAGQRSVKLLLRTRLAGLRVRGDENRLMQVVTNFLSNAVKFSDAAGQVEVDVGDANGLARVTVTDHGPGIPEASQPKIFQKFYQADGSSSRTKGGTGLGLSICKALLERMDGQIGFTSRPGETVFHFDLPREAPNA